MINQYGLEKLNQPQYKLFYKNSKTINNYSKIMEQIMEQKNQIIKSLQYENQQRIKYKLNKSKQLQKYIQK